MIFNETLQRLAKSFLVGFFGSAAYITALCFKFIGDNEKNRQVVIKPFLNKNGRVSVPKCFWYCLVGGFVAGVFQYDVSNFVPVQGLILGATWPAVVSQFLSGRMANPTFSELTDILSNSSSNIGASEIDNIKEKLK